MLRLLLRASASSTGLVLQRCLKMSFWTQVRGNVVANSARMKAVVNDDGLPLLSWASRKGVAPQCSFCLSMARTCTRGFCTGKYAVAFGQVVCVVGKDCAGAVMQGQRECESKNDTTPLLRTASEEFRCAGAGSACEAQGGLEGHRTQPRKRRGVAILKTSSFCWMPRQMSRPVASITRSRHCILRCIIITRRFCLSCWKGSWDQCAEIIRPLE